MIVHGNPLIEYRHYRRLSVREGQGIYRFETLVPISWVFSSPVTHLRKRLSFRDRWGKEWLLLAARTATIPARYQWNGNSPKKGIRLLGFDLWLGVPDSPRTISASLLHDSFFQFSGTEKFPIGLDDANDCYEQLLRAEHFPHAGSYRGVLDEISTAFWSRPAAGTHCVEL